MRVPSTAELRRRLHELSPEERTAFVADLLGARGWRVDRDGRTLTAVRGDTEKQVTVGPPLSGADPDEVVLLPTPGWRPWPVGDERVERRAKETGATVLSPADLRELLRYGIDEPTARELLESHVGPDVVTDVDTDAASETAAATADSATPRWAVGVAGTVALAALLLLTVWVVSPASLGAGPAPSTATAVDTPASESRQEAGPPPGVTATGIVSVERLTRSHLAALNTRPGMAMNATFAGPRFLTGFDTFRSGFNEDDRVTVQVRVASPDRYTIRRQLEFPSGSGLTDGSEGTLERFADGRREYRLIDDGSDRRYDRRSLSAVRDGSAEIDGWTRTLFAQYLNTTDSRVERVENSSRYRLVATGEPRRLDHDTREYRAVAILTADGFVETLAVAYDHPGTGTTVRVTVAYSRTAVEVATPAWYEEARANTDS